MTLHEVKRQELPPLDDAFAQGGRGLRDPRRAQGRDPRGPPAEGRSGRRQPGPGSAGPEAGRGATASAPPSLVAPRDSRLSARAIACRRRVRRIRRPVPAGGGGTGAAGSGALRRGGGPETCTPPRRTWTPGSPQMAAARGVPPARCTARCRRRTACRNSSAPSPRTRSSPAPAPVHRHRGTGDPVSRLSSLYHRAIVPRRADLRYLLPAADGPDRLPRRRRSTTTSPTSSSPSCSFSRPTTPRRTSTST